MDSARLSVARTSSSLHVERLHRSVGSHRSLLYTVRRPSGNMNRFVLPAVFVCLGKCSEPGRVRRNRTATTTTIGCTVPLLSAFRYDTGITLPQSPRFRDGSPVPPRAVRVLRSCRGRRSHPVDFTSCFSYRQQRQLGRERNRRGVCH